MNANNKDIRWLQRLSSFEKAVFKMEEVVNGETAIKNLSNLEKEGLIQRFEYTYELAWKTLKDFLEFKGYTNINSPNDVLKQSFANGYITNHDLWRRMNKARNLTSHIYDEKQVFDIAHNIAEDYYILLKELYLRLTKEANKE